MQKYLWHMCGLFLAAAILPPHVLDAADLQQRFLPSGVTKRVGGYRPMRAEMDKTADIVKQAPEGLEVPKFGTIEIDKKQWAFVIDEPDGKPAALYIDTNGDGDLTNDPKTKWESRKQGALTMYSGEGQVDLGDGHIGTVGLYRFDPADARRAALKNTLMFYLDYGFEFTLELDGKKFDTFVAGNLDEKVPLPVDRDGNGQISRTFEVVHFDKPFNFTGSTYVLSLSEGKPTLETAEEEVAELPLPPDLRIGKPALTFAATTMNGESIDFPKHYAGKIVMLDFWATWCGPCIAEIPNMKKAYASWNKAGFEILGVSFDGEGEEEKIKKFLEKNELPWSQIYEGKQWDTTLGKLHDVSGIPFVLLVDGDSGTILATSRELRGPGLSSVIGDQLLRKAVQAEYGTDAYWTAALAFWERAVEQQPDLAQSAFGSFAQAERWQDAAKFGLLVTEQNASDSHAWLSVAPVLILAGDDDGYRQLCSRMVDQFRETTNPQAATHTCKACLLVPGIVDVSELPEKPLTASLEDGSTASELIAFRWGTKALLAYRRGDAELALEHLEKAQGAEASDVAQAQNLLIRTLAEASLNKTDEARNSLQQAAKLISKIEEGRTGRTPGGQRDLLIAHILMREAKATHDKKGTQ